MTSYIDQTLSGKSTEFYDLTWISKIAEKLKFLLVYDHILRITSTTDDIDVNRISDAKREANMITQ